MKTNFIKKEIGILTTFFFVAYLLLNSSNATAQPDLVNLITSPQPSINNTSDNSGAYTSTIPLDIYKGREFDLPMSLSYTAKGIRVDQKAGAVGLGWNLNAGGKLSRIVNGLPDDRSVTVNQPWGCFPIDGSGMNDVSVRDYYSASSYGFNAVAQYISPTATAIIGILNNPYIHLNTENSALGAQNNPWVFTDIDGTQYIFGENNARERIHSVTSSSFIFTDNTYYSQVVECLDIPLDYTAAWMLTKIISKNGVDVYDFKYREFEWTKSITDNKDAWTYQYVNIHGPYYTTSSYRLVEQNLSEIFHNGEKIVGFEYAPREDMSFSGGATDGNALSQILFYNFKSVAAFKKIGFGYSYFETIINPEPLAVHLNKRLKLDNVTFYGQIGSTIAAGEKYEFHYNNETGLPSLTSAARDYLGLYNGKNNNVNLLPNGTSRNFDLNYALDGTLDKITYPDKGFVEFAYEQNRLEGGYGTVTTNHTSTVSTQIDLVSTISTIPNICDGEIDEVYTGGNVDHMLNVTLNPYPYSLFSGAGPFHLSGVKSIMMRLEEDTDAFIQTSGQGVFLIQSINGCNDSLDTPVNLCSADNASMNPCMIHTSDIYYTGSVSSQNDSYEARGLTQRYNDPNPDPLPHHFAAGTYQITLWNYDSYEFSPTLRIFRVDSHEVTTAVTQNLDVVSPAVDGFRIKSITSYTALNVRAAKKIFKYGNGLLEYFENHYTKSFPFIGDVYFQTSRGYVNTENFIGYGSIYEISVDMNDQDNGYMCNEYFGGTAYPFMYYGAPDVSVKPIYTRFNPYSQWSIKTYDHLSRLMKHTEYTAGSSSICYIYEPAVGCEFQSTFDFLALIKNTDIPDPASPANRIESLTSFEYMGGGSLLQKCADSDCEAFGYEFPGELGPTSIATNKGYWEKGLINKQLTVAGNTFNRYLVDEVKYARTSDNPADLEPLVKYKYDDTGSLVEKIQFTPGTLTAASYESYIYGYNNHFIVAKLEGVPYSAIQALGNRISNIHSKSDVPISPSNDTILRDELNTLRSDFPNALITTYTCNPAYGITSATDPKGYTVYSEYDIFGRLQFTKQENASGNNYELLSETQYHTRP